MHVNRSSSLAQLVLLVWGDPGAFAIIPPPPTPTAPPQSKLHNPKLEVCFGPRLAWDKADIQPHWFAFSKSFENNAAHQNSAIATPDGLDLAAIEGNKEIDWFRLLTVAKNVKFKLHAQFQIVGRIIMKIVAPAGMYIGKIQNQREMGGAKNCQMKISEKQTKKLNRQYK